MVGELLHAAQCAQDAQMPAGSGAVRWCWQEVQTGRETEQREIYMQAMCVVRRLCQRSDSQQPGAPLCGAQSLWPSSPIVAAGPAQARARVDHSVDHCVVAELAWRVSALEYLREIFAVEIVATCVF